MVGTERRASKEEQKDLGSEGHHVVPQLRVLEFTHAPREAKRHSAEGDEGVFNRESPGLKRYCKKPCFESGMDESRRGERRTPHRRAHTSGIKGQKMDMKQEQRHL